MKPRLNDDDNSWSRWQKLIVAELERLDSGMIALHTKIDTFGAAKLEELIAIRVDIATLKERMRIQAGLIGGVLGTVMGIISAIIVTYVKH